jgi:hypothetical protein
MIGTHVTTPRGGESAVIAEQNDVRTVATHDGDAVDRTAWCSDPNGVAACRGSIAVYYEVTDGLDRGAHGWACSTCRRIVQTG